MLRRRTALIVGLAVAVGVACATPARGQALTSNCPETTVKSPTVVDSKDTKDGTKIVGTTWTELGRTVMVVIDGVCAWVRDNKADPNKLRLYLGGHLLEQSAPTVVNLGQDYIKFDLQLEPAVNRAQWVKILWTVRTTEDQRINIAVGNPSTQQIFESNKFIVFNLYPSYTRWVVIGFGLLGVALVALGWGTSLLRIPDAPSGVRAPFSLGLVQMAWWFYLIVGCYLSIWLITGEYNTLTEGVLALAGISATTGLGAAFVENQKRQAIETQRRGLSSEETALESRIAEIVQSNPASGSQLDIQLQDLRSKLAKVKADLATAPALPPPPTTRGFIRDLLSDGDGIKFHRFQVVVWTIVLGMVFIRLVYNDLTMPEFSAMLLGLMGLSSGTYIGFKFPEAAK